MSNERHIYPEAEVVAEALFDLYRAQISHKYGAKWSEVDRREQHRWIADARVILARLA